MLHPRGGIVIGAANPALYQAAGPTHSHRAPVAFRGVQCPIPFARFTPNRVCSSAELNALDHTEERVVQSVSRRLWAVAYHAAFGQSIATTV
jgi:hypothetical protein